MRRSLMKLKGVDISYCQHGLDFTALKDKGISFALIRAGHGLKADTLFETNTRGVAAQGIKFGYYWFSEANTVAGVRAEAAKCISMLGTWYKNQEYPVFFDLEDASLVKGMSPQDVSDLAIAFCSAMNAAGYYAGIYTNPDWLDHHYDKLMLLNKYDIWLAHWTYDENKDSNRNFGQTIHQWGIIKVGKIDVDADNCYIDYPAKIAAWRASRNTSTGQKFNKGSKVTLLGIPAYANFADVSPIKTIMPDSTQYIISTGLVENNRIRIQSPTNANDTFYVPVECVKLTGDKMAKVTYTDAQLTAIAKRVISGEFGAGSYRKILLAKYGYPVEEVQAKVNELLSFKK